jgi:colanic acid/amylovoran biosynthesis glycosyltransferase
MWFILKFLKNFSLRNLQLLFIFLKNKFTKDHYSIYQLIPFFDNNSFDIVHAHFGNIGIYLLRLKRMGLFTKAKFITTFHGYDLIVERGYYDELFNKCDSFTVNSNYSKRKLLHLGCPQYKISLLPVGLDTCLFKKNRFINPNDDIVTLLFIGRLIKFKGPDIFIDLCYELKNKYQLNFRAVVVGDGILMGELSDKIKNLYLSDQVMLVGAKTQNEIISIMTESDIFILPGITANDRAENQGLVIQEAQSMQIPVLISDAGGMSEGVINGVTGYIIKEGDINGFVQKIHLLAKDKKLQQSMGESGRAFVQRYYDSTFLNKQLLAIYSF